MKAGDGPMGRNAIFYVANQETTLWAEKYDRFTLVANSRRKRNLHIAYWIWSMS